MDIDTRLTAAEAAPSRGRAAADLDTPDPPPEEAAAAVAANTLGSTPVPDRGRRPAGD